VISVGPSVSLAANGSVAPLAPDPKAIRRTLEVLAAIRPDVLHLHEPLVPGPALAALLAGSVPAVGTFHASGRVPAYVWLRPAVRAVARRIGLRTAVSPEARALAERWLGGACHVMPNGVEVERFAKADPWPSPETPGGSGRAILFVGRHEPRKGLEVLLKAFSALDTDAVLWVAGEGPETAALAGPAPGRVEWLGRISDEELAGRMRTAAVFCAPSLHGESFGVVLLEAMAAGTPVVASDIAGYRDVARHDREAVLVPGGDPAALTDGLRRVLDDPILSGRLVEAGTARAAGFSMERLAGRYVELYETLLARTP
jgi:phosphatidylinositol alpha-mannosyltransferase